MKTLLLLIAISTFLTFNLSCRKDPVQSQETDNSLPGRRDYEWTVDTLKGEWNAYLSGIWGSGPDDVWAVGSAGATIDAIWHYDGAKWEQRWPGISSNLTSVYGFAQNNVWAVGSPGDQIYHFEGSSWKVAVTLGIPGYQRLGFNHIWGDSWSNIYAVGSADSLDGKGYKGIIAHYDGNKWELVKIPNYRVAFGNIRREKESRNYYLSAVQFESTGETSRVFEYDGKQLKEIFSSQTEHGAVCEVDGKVYMVIDKKICQYLNNQFSVWKDFTGTEYGGWMQGRSTKDFFAMGPAGLMHYNGTDLQTIYPISTGVWNMAVFPNDIFFLSNINGITLVIHGKLKQ